jgi:hypothetical protein
MAGRSLEHGGDLVQGGGDAAPGYDLKFSGLHGTRPSQSKNRSEQDIDRPFAHDAPLFAACCTTPSIMRRLVQLSVVPAVPARDTYARGTIAVRLSDLSNIAAETAGKSAELFSRHAAAAGISESLLPRAGEVIE